MASTSESAIPPCAILLFSPNCRVAGCPFHERKIECDLGDIDTRGAGFRVAAPDAKWNHSRQEYVNVMNRRSESWPCLQDDPPDLGHTPHRHPQQPECSNNHRSKPA